MLCRAVCAFAANRQCCEMAVRTCTEDIGGSETPFIAKGTILTHDSLERIGMCIA